MLEMHYDGGVGGLWESMGVGLGSLEVVQTNAGPIVLGVSGREGGVVCIGFDTAGDLRILDQRYFDNTTLNAVDGRLAVVQAAGETVVLVGGQGGDTLVGYQMSTNGLGRRITLEGVEAAGRPGTLISQTDNGFIFCASTDGSLRYFHLDQTNNLVVGDVPSNMPTVFQGLPTALTSVSIAGQSYLLSLSANDAVLSVFAVNNATGALSETASMGARLGLGLYETPNDLVTAEIGGRTYVIVASRGETTGAAALSVLELTADGALFITDHIIDNLTTRFGAVSGISVVEHNEFQYVAAAGADQGVDLFALMPNGKLVLLDTITTHPGAHLDSLTDVAAMVVGNKLTVLATSHLDDQITTLSVDLSNQGQMLHTGDGGEALEGGMQNDMLVGGRGSDTLSGGAGDDIIYSGGGADVFVGGAGADRFVIAFDGGHDTISDFNHREDQIDLSHIPMVYSLSQVTFTSYSWGGMLGFRGQELKVHNHGGRLLIDDLERSVVWSVDRPPLVVQNEVRGGADADTLEGSEVDDVIVGGDGDDLIYGGGGNDQIDGGMQSDTVFAGTGNDTVEGGPGSDTIYLGEGGDVYLDTGTPGAGHDDLVFGQSGDDTITSQLGNDELHGGAGNDSLIGGAGNDKIYGGINFDWIAGRSGNDTIWGGNGRDVAFLGIGDDLFIDNGQGGELGRDTVFTGLGNDTVEGGNGDDVFFGEDGNDFINARLGNDTVYGGNNFDTISAGAGNDEVHGGNGRDLIFLNQGDDLFIDNGQGGELGRDTVFTGLGNDTVEGGNGDDVFFGEDGNDVINARLGNDTVYGGNNFDTISAGAGNDKVLGGNGRDLIFLGEGNDLYIDTAQAGTLGQDTINGGPGADTFVFGLDISNDVIVDFEPGVDVLRFDNLLTQGFSASELVLNLTEVTSDGVLIGFGAGDSLLLKNLTRATGLASDIEFF